MWERLSPGWLQRKWKEVGFFFPFYFQSNISDFLHFRGYLCCIKTAAGKTLGPGCPICSGGLESCLHPGPGLTPDVKSKSGQQWRTGHVYFNTCTHPIHNASQPTPPWPLKICAHHQPAPSLTRNMPRNHLPGKWDSGANWERLSDPPGTAEFGNYVGIITEGGTNALCVCLVCLFQNNLWLPVTPVIQGSNV